MTPIDSVCSPKAVCRNPCYPLFYDQHAVAYTGVKLDVIDPPSLATLSAKPNRQIFMAIGFGAGFLSALVMAIFRRRPPAIPLPAQTA